VSFRWASAVFIDNFTLAHRKLTLNQQELVEYLTPIPIITISNNVAPHQMPNDTETLDTFT
jgi:hypothetical protein